MNRLLFAATLTALITGLVLALGCALDNNLGDSDFQITTTVPEEGFQDSYGTDILFSSLSDALSSSENLKCTAAVSGNNAELWINGNIIYYELTAEGRRARVLYLDDKVYAWAEGDDWGILLNEGALNEEGRQLGTYQTRFVYSREALVSNSANTECFELLNADDSIFSLPAGVDFKSRDEMIQEINEEMKDMQ